MSDVGDYATFPIVVTVVIGSRHKVDTGPTQLFEVCRIRTSESAARHARRMLEIMHQHLKVGVADIGVPEQFDE